MLSWLWPFIKPYRIRLCVALVALIITAGLTLSIVQGIRLMVDQGLSAPSEEGLANALSLFAVSRLCMSIGSYILFYLVSWI